MATKKLGKIKIVIKDPDGVSEAIREMAEASIPESITDVDEQADLIEKRSEKISDAMKAFVEYDEYVTVEIDLDEQTARVIPLREHQS